MAGIFQLSNLQIKAAALLQSILISQNFKHFPKLRSYPIYAILGNVSFANLDSFERVLTTLVPKVVIM